MFDEDRTIYATRETRTNRHINEPDP
jgi:hypothetical protein